MIMKYAIYSNAKFKVSEKENHTIVQVTADDYEGYGMMFDTKWLAVLSMTPFEYFELQTKKTIEMLDSKVEALIVQSSRVSPSEHLIRQIHSLRRSLGPLNLDRFMKHTAYTLGFISKPPRDKGSVREELKKLETECEAAMGYSLSLRNEITKVEEERDKLKRALGVASIGRINNDK